MTETSTVLHMQRTEKRKQNQETPATRELLCYVNRHSEMVLVYAWSWNIVPYRLKYIKSCKYLMFLAQKNGKPAQKEITQSEKCSVIKMFINCIIIGIVGNNLHVQ